MIDMHEMRLGNFLIHETEGLINIGHIQDNFYGVLLNGCSTEYFSPIPLNEELFLKLGFEKDYDGTYTIQTGRQAFRICTAEDNCIIYRPDVGLRWRIIHDGLDYVHQLQNLYFALTGEELSLK